MAKKKYNWKELLFTIHLWLGLASGLVVSVICLTGFYLGAYPLVENWLNRDLYSRTTTAPALAVAELIRSASDESGLEFHSLEIPTDESRPWVLKAGRRSYYVEPSSGKVLGRPKPFLGNSYEICVKLHRWLLLGRGLGRTLTGAATMMFVVILLTGLCLWLVKTAKARTRGLCFRRGVGWRRFNYDSHLILGFYAAGPLLVMAVTGLSWSYPQAFRKVTYGLLDRTAPPEKQAGSRSPASHPGLNIDLPYQKIREYFGAEPGRLIFYLPLKGRDHFTVAKLHDAGLGSLPIQDKVIFRVRSGLPSEEKLFVQKSRAGKFLSLVKPLHMGHIQGPFSLLIYLCCSLTGALLPLSGTLMWWNRMKCRRRRKDS